MQAVRILRLIPSLFVVFVFFVIGPKSQNENHKLKE